MLFVAGTLMTDLLIWHDGLLTHNIVIGALNRSATRPLVPWVWHHINRVCTRIALVSRALRHGMICVLFFVFLFFPRLLFNLISSRDDSVRLVGHSNPITNFFFLFFFHFTINCIFVILGISGLRCCFQHTQSRVRFLSPQL